MTTSVHAPARSHPAERRRTTLGALVWVGILSLAPVERLISSLAGTVPAQGVLVALLACAALGRLARPVFAPWWPVLGALTVASALLTGQGVVPGASLWAGVRLGVVLALTPFVLAFYIREHRRFLGWAVIGFVLVQSASAVGAVLQWGGLGFFGMYARGGRANGLAVHPNILGLMSALVVTVVLHRLLSRAPRSTTQAVVLLPLHVVAVFLSGSLSGSLALVAGGLVVAAVHRFLIRGLVLAAVALAGVAAMAVAGAVDLGGVTQRFTERVQSVSGVGSEATGSLLERQLTYEYALDWIARSPVVGRGLDDVNAGTYNGETVVHNFLLRSWFQGGLLLVVVALAVHVMAVVAVVRAWRRRTDAVAAGTIAAILTYAASAAFLGQYQYWLPLLAAFAALPVAGRPALPPSAPDRPGPADALAGRRDHDSER